MAVAVILPKLDEAMLTAKIVQWLKKEGDRVEKGEGIVEIETEKVTFEVEAEGSGILSKVMVSEGDEVPVGAVIAFILQPGEEAPEVPEPVVVAKEEPAQVEAPKPSREISAVKASPVARKMAQEHGIDLSVVKGTGPDGRIVREDVQKAIDESKVTVTQPVREEPGLVEEETLPLSSMRKTIARRMTESFQTPHFYVSVEVETQELEKLRQQLIPLIESQIGVRLTLTDLMIKAVTKALADNPSVNSAYSDGGVRVFKQAHIGLVTSVEGGLVVPVIRQANEKTLAEIAKARDELVEKVKTGKLSMAEMRGSTFTISNMGMYQVDYFSAIIQPPEAAILAIGRIADRAVVRNNEIVIRPMMTLTLSIDHRVLDGAAGANFLQSLKNYIENPVNLPF